MFHHYFLLHGHIASAPRSTINGSITATASGFSVFSIISRYIASHLLRNIVTALSGRIICKSLAFSHELLKLHFHNAFCLPMPINYISSIISAISLSAISLLNLPSSNSTTSPISFWKTNLSLPLRTFLSVYSFLTSASRSM